MSSAYGLGDDLPVVDTPQQLVDLICHTVKCRVIGFWISR